MERRYGWIVLLVSAAAMVGSLPGRTQGLGLVTEPLLVDLGIDRVRYATLNLWATLIGSAGALGIGYAIDRAGSRIVLTIVLAALGLVVCLMSLADTFFSLAVWITLTRALGQSALSVVSLAIVGHWFVRRIDTAMAVYSIAISIGFMAAFPLVGAGVQAWGWRGAWLAVGVVIAGVLAPMAAFIVRRSPESIGLAPDSQGTRPEPETGRGLEGYRWTAAIAMPSFWVFAIGTALYGLVASGIGLFNESILAERGFEAAIYHRSLVFTALAALAGNFAAGGLAARRDSLRSLLVVSMLLLASGLAALPHVATTLHVILYAVTMGIAGGFVMVVFFSFWGQTYGRRHLGRIQGAAQALTVVASAVGPLLLAWCVRATGSYAAAFYTLSAAVLLLTAAAAIVHVPSRSHR